MTSVTTSGSPVAAAIKVGDHYFAPAITFARDLAQEHQLSVRRVCIEKVIDCGARVITTDGFLLLASCCFDSQQACAKHMLESHAGDFKNAEREVGRCQRMLAARDRLRAISEGRV